MLSFLRPAGPTKTMTAHKTALKYEDGASGAEWFPGDAEYFMTTTVPAANTTTAQTRTFHCPPLHYHAYQLEKFKVVSGTCKFFVDDATVERRAGETAEVPAGAYHRFENASSDEPLVLGVRLEEQDRDAEEGFFRNFFGYLDDCIAQRQAPSLFQMERFLMRIDCPVAVAPGFLPASWRRSFDWGFMVFFGYVVGECLLGYKDTYPEYYQPEGKKAL